MASQSDLYSLALAQGLTPARAKIAAAVGMAESGGDARSHNTNASTGDNSYGYWQINMLGKLQAERLALLGIATNDELFEPEKNAHAMRVLSANGADFSPWSAYKSGAYKEFLNVPVTDQTKDPLWKTALNSAVGAVIPGAGLVSGLIPGGGSVTEVAGGIGSAIETLNKTAAWISNSENWVRIGYVVGGSAMILVGLAMMIQSSSLGSAAMNLVPAGRVANLVKKGTS